MAATIWNCSGPISARFVKSQLQTTPFGCPPSKGGSCFHARHNLMGNILWADGHAKSARALLIERPNPPMDLVKAKNLGDIDRDGLATTDELWDLE
jgi:prepilin-type processing-associated H-X9-DG protein